MYKVVLTVNQVLESDSARRGMGIRTKLTVAENIIGAIMLLLEVCI